MFNDFEQQFWFSFLDHGQVDLLLQSRELYQREVKQPTSDYHDYSFVVFPMAKCFEGFLKKYLYSLDLISQASYEGDHFRIGKSLNPDLPERYRNHDWVVGALDQRLGVVSDGPYKEQRLSRVLWNCWKNSRNLLFHYFPQHQNFITLDQAKNRMSDIIYAIEAAMQCNQELHAIETGH